jgi:hypothetical protein
MFREQYKNWLMACLVFLSTGMGASPPNWSVTPAQFQYSMDVNAKVSLNGSTVNSGLNKVGAFVGGQCRGVGTPTMLNGQAFYFFTVFSNQTSGETIEFRFYSAADDQIVVGVQTVSFVRNSQLGSVLSPHILSFYTANDYPIALMSVDTQRTFLGQAFSGITLAPLLQSVDSDPVVWTAQGGIHLTPSIVGGVLTVTSVVSDWFGIDTVRITATETGTSAAHSASRTVVYNLLPDFTFRFNNLPSQIILPGQTFPGFDLDDYLESGACRQFNIEMLPFSGTVASPTWSVAASGNGTMSIIGKVRFGDAELATPGCTLAAYVGGTLRGVATPIFSGGSYWYFMVLSSGAVGNISFKFYDAARQYQYDIASTLSFSPNATVGSIPAPQIIQAAPLDVQATAGGQVSATIQNTVWTGSQQVRIIGWDCDDATLKRDTGIAYFNVDPAYTGAPYLFTPDTVRFLENSCTELYDTGAFDNLDAEGSGLTYSVVGGADQAKFALDGATGLLRWAGSKPNYEAPTDANTDNTYEISIQVTDQAGLTDVLLLHVLVTDNAVESFNPTITGTLTGCPGFTTELKADGAARYLWSTSDITARITNIGHGTYSVTATDAFECTLVRSVTVVEKTPPTVSFTGTTTLCQGTGTTVTASGGATYLWNTGATAAALTVTPSATTSYSVTVTGANGCTSTASSTVTVLPVPVPTAMAVTHISCNGLSDGAIDLSASGGVLPYGYDWGVGQPMTEDLSGLASGTYTVTVTDSNVCTGTLAVSVTQPAVLSGTVLGTLANCSSTVGTANLTMTGGTTPYHYHWSDSTTAEDLGSLVYGTYAVTITDDHGCTTTASTVLGATCKQITGKIHWYSDTAQSITGVRVSLSGDDVTSVVAGSDGRYILYGGGSNFILKPSRTSGKLNGVTAADASRLAQHVSGTGSLTEAHAYIAGDVDHNNVLNTLDVAYIKNALLGNPIALIQFQQSWRFMPLSTTLSAPGSGSFWNFSESITLSGIGADQTDQNFMGIKIGDVVTPNSNPGLKPSAAVPVLLSVPDMALEAGDTVEVPVQVEHFDDLLALQASFWFNADILAFENIVSVPGMPIQTANFGTWELSQGRLRLVWAVSEGLTLPGKSLLFILRFRVKTGGQSLREALSISGKNLEPLAWHSDYRSEPLTMVYQPLLETQQRSESMSGADDFKLYQNEPNPFSEKTTIGFQLPGETMATLTVYDQTGRVVLSRQGEYEKGYHAIVLGRGVLNATGVMYYTLKTATESETKKMIRAR